MAVTQGPRLGLTRWSDPVVDGPSVAQFDDDNRTLDDLAAIDIQVQTIGNRPAAGIRGRYCWVVDAAALYRDTGTSWHGPMNVSFTTAAPTGAGPGAAGSVGTATTVPRSDHQHPTPPWATAVSLAGGATSAGTASSIPRGDHRHAVEGGYVRLDTGGDLAYARLVRPQLLNYTERVVGIPAANLTVALDLSAGNVFDVTLAGAVTLGFAGAPPAGQAGSMTLYLRQDATGGRTVTWPANAQFPGGVRPFLSTAPNSLNIASVTTVDAGATWQVFLAGSGMAAGT